MKRILHIVGTMNRAGAETMVMNLYRAIDRTKYQFDFVYFTQQPCDFDKEIEDLGGRIFRISEKEFNSSFKRTYKLYQIIKENKPFHAVQCHQLLANSFHLMAAYFAGIKIRLAHAHSTRDFNDNSFARRFYRKFSKFLIKSFSTNFVACGVEAGNFLFPKVNKNKILFIPNAIDVHKFLSSRNHRDKTIFFKNNQIKEDTIVFSQIGRFMEVKNHKFSVDFALYLKSLGIDFQMFFVGFGVLEDKIKELVIDKNLSNNITFLGLREDIDLILANTDIMLMPSLYEGFPVILVESQAAGTPALISDQISNEVDLGMDLVKFCDLNATFDIWLDKTNLLLSTQKNHPEERLEILRKRGFDIDVSVKVLEKVYN